VPNNGTETVATTGVDVADGEWHHVVYSLDGDASTLYVDGDVAATGDFGYSGFDWSSFMLLGGAGFEGSIKDFKVFEGGGT
jgi:predicted cupin superfamily sugar epimerase